LFCGDYVDLDKCPMCGCDRYKRKKDGGDDNNADDGNPPEEIRRKKKVNSRGHEMVAWYVCIIPLLKRWFPRRKEAQLLCWHKVGRKKENDKLRHPTDAAQWGNINSHFMWFADDSRNVTNGMNPFGNQSSTHNTWPVVLSMYNLETGYARKQEINDADNIGLLAKAIW
jgi:hypothetical protein